MSDQSNAYVRFREVQKSYDGETLVVKNLNLDIPRGEFLTMLGPSGSGKTTCLMMLAGFETATHGEIYLDGVPINNLAPHKRNIGMVFQNYALFPHMTIAENLAFPLKVRRVPQSEITQRVQKALDMVALGHLGGRRPGQLSGGQQQRVAVARALVFEPKLVLMDEPLGALDKQLREQMQYEIKHLHDRLGITVVYVTHDQSEALTMSDRIAVFNDGVIQQLATPADLYERPVNAFVAQFIGENNRLTGTVREVNGSHCTVQVDSGEVVRALKINVDGVGSRSTLSLRPERVTLNPAPGSHPNEFDAEVRELIYLGDHIRTRVAVCGHDDFIIKVPNSAQQQPPAPGHRVRIGWQVDDCRALDA
ncbi:MAG TPA: ABC transporter ATP-binding protein [Candidatus Competibacteraceae bacterium]|nr:ABC transporter ATP-binding protein [Candidatus Competibacteraceae bacterium]